MSVPSQYSDEANPDDAWLDGIRHGAASHSPTSDLDLLHSEEAMRKRDDDRTYKFNLSKATTRFL